MNRMYALLESKGVSSRAAFTLNYGNGYVLTAIVEFGYIGPHAKWGSRLRDSRGESIRDL